MPEEQDNPQIVIVEKPDNEISELVTSCIARRTDVSLEYLPGTTYEQWEKLHHFHAGIGESSLWWVGDSIRWAEKAYGEKYTQAIDLTGKEYSTLTTVVSVCERFSEITRRRNTKRCGFWMCAEVAYIPPQEGDYILDQVERGKMSRQEVRDAVARKQGRKTKAERDAEKSKGGVIKHLPPAAKVGPMIEMHAAPVKQGFIWDSHPVTTRDGLLFAGDELAPMAADESDRCAHHFGFASAEAMVNHLAGLKQAEPATPETASKPQDAAPVTTPPKEEPTPTAPNTAQEPEYTQHEPNQALALERSEAAMNRWIETIPLVNWEALTPLTKKRWLNKILISADELIDRLQKGLP